MTARVPSVEPLSKNSISNDANPKNSDNSDNVEGFTSLTSRPRGASLAAEHLAPLVDDARTGDPAAVKTLLDVLIPVVVRYCRARMGGRDLSYLSADDVAQEVCIAVLKALPNYEDRGGSFLYLVRAIAANKVVDVYRQISRDRAEPVAELPEHPQHSNEPERHALRMDLGARLNQLLQLLPPLHQEILILRVAVGLSATETAQALNLSPSNVRVTQHRALHKLRALAQPTEDF